MRVLTAKDRCCGTCERWGGQRSLDSGSEKVFATEHATGSCNGGTYHHHKTDSDGFCNLYSRMYGFIIK